MPTLLADNPLFTLFNQDRLPPVALLVPNDSTTERWIGELIDTLSIGPGDIFRFANEAGLKMIDAKAIRRFVQQSRHQAAIKLIIIKEAADITPEAANALLKTLEEPPLATHFVLTTNRPEAILPTVRSRCQLIRSSGTADEHVDSADQSYPLLTRRPLSEYFTLAKEMAASETDLARLFDYWLIWLAKQAPAAINQRWLEITLRYRQLASSTANRRLLLDNFFLELYNSD